MMISQGMMTPPVSKDILSFRPAIAYHLQGKQKFDNKSSTLSLGPPFKKPRNEFQNPPVRHTTKRSIPTVNSSKIETSNKFQNLKEKTLTGNSSASPENTKTLKIILSQNLSTFP